MNRSLTVGLTSVLLVATTALASTSAEVTAVVRDYVSGGDAVVEMYEAFAASRADRAIAGINAANTIPEAASAANQGCTSLSVERGEAVDDRDRETLNSIGDHLKMAKDRLSAVRSSHLVLKGPHRSHLKALKASFEQHRERITRAENARKAALRARR